jgi:type IV fimbrial biogenesis protein FimT
MMKTNAGFTLIELLMVVMIAGIVLTLGIPSFQESIRNNRLTVHANELIGALNLARSEAIKRRASIEVCASTDQASCNGSSWAGGWIVRVQNGELIRAFEPMKGSITVNSGGISRFTYNQNGFLTAGGGTLRLCAGAGKSGREVQISATGRPASINPHPTC